MAFVLTCDLDWASEPCIEHFLRIAARFQVKPTVFVTHASEAVREAARAGQVELGIHPNFLPDSTQGGGVDAVLDHTLALAPRAVAVRCHRHVTSPAIERALAERGLRFDSNTCRQLEPDIAPIELASGLRRFPVFFEDDIHWGRPRSWRFEDHTAAFFSAGLKILNFHPFMVALNAPDGAFYARHKHLIPTLGADEAAGLRHPGLGAGTFLVEALAAIQAAGHRFMTLSELAAGREQVAEHPGANRP
jgi:hypothetical protein